MFNYLLAAYNVEAGLQPNYNQSAASNQASNHPTGQANAPATGNATSHIDNRAIIQPYSLGTGPKQPEYQFAADNRGYEPDSHANGKQQDVERDAPDGGHGGHGPPGKGARVVRDARSPYPCRNPLPQ